ncbi:MAG TPA: glutathione S-transferase N-terminal domain-containing protein, partial [Rubrobacteraceae bacterium]|nr:glutathione S-transferase N-terminal domain-containing protein [Rubrobacteraceae bacterium]
MLRLHDKLASGNGYKARLLLARLAIPFERVEYDIDSGETRTPEFLVKVNPNGRIPVLETEDGRFLPESNAILCYLAEGSPLIPNERFERAQVLRWM